MTRHAIADNPDGHDEYGPYWECPDCTVRHRTSEGRARCCFYD